MRKQIRKYAIFRWLSIHLLQAKNEREMGEETEGKREMERKRKKKDWQKRKRLIERDSIRSDLIILDTDDN